jgi:hypothetical protein
MLKRKIKIKKPPFNTDRGERLGRKRLPEEERKLSVWIRIRWPVIEELEKEGELRPVIERILEEYVKKNKNSD